jgi:hypothetical protein
MKPEYHEGDEALAKFEKTVTTLFSAPKTVAAKQVKKKPVAKRKKTSKG